MNIEEQNKIMQKALRDIEAFAERALYTYPNDSAACHDHFVAALRGIAQLICDQAKQRIFEPPPAQDFVFANPPLGRAGAPRTPLSPNENSANPKIGTLPAKFIHGDGFWTGFAVNSQRQVYNVTVRNEKPTEDTITGTFSIDGDVKFVLSANSFRRALLCTLASSNAYIGENNKAKERRRRAKERRVSPSPVEKIDATVARQEGRAE